MKFYIKKLRASWIPASAGMTGLILLLSQALFAVEGGHVQARLLSEASVVRPGDTVWLGIYLKMDPRWHTYWKNPGDSGMATRVQWTLPKGTAAGPIHWPAPKRIELPPLVSYGYEDEVLLLVPVKTGPASGKNLSIAAKVDWLECEEICIPGKANLKINIPLGKATMADPTQAELFSRFRAQLPLPATEWKVSAHRVKNRVRLRVTPPSGESEPGGNILFFPSDPEAFEASAVQIERRLGRDSVIELPILEAASEVNGVLVRRNGWRGPGSEQAWEFSIPFSATPAEKSLAWIFLFAFAGGLLLNLMPCVLPVLSLKAFGLLHDASLAPAARRRQGWLYTVGVLVSFWALAGLLLALRAGGEQLGWGFHLQSPRFVIFLIALFALMTANLFGLFEVGGSLVGAGSGRKKSWGSFGSGVLATVVATPCTAPFMGTAVGVALSQPAPLAFGIFSALGLGMAFPYWLLTALPGAARWLPKPGPWMNHLKKVLGILLLGTAAWLFWVLRQQAPGAALPVVFLSVSLFVFGWTLGLRQRGKPARVMTAGAAALVLAIAAFQAGGRQEEAPATAVYADWETYSPERIASLEKAGRPYFIDFTAAWCLTCQVNKRTTLEKPEVVEEFKARGVTLLRADWTNRSGTITEALAQYGRSGVPVYVLKGSVGRGAPDTGGGRAADSEAPVLLPTLLTPAIVLEALEKIETKEKI